MPWMNRICWKRLFFVIYVELMVSQRQLLILFRPVGTLIIDELSDVQMFTTCGSKSSAAITESLFTQRWSASIQLSRASATNTGMGVKSELAKGSESTQKEINCLTKLSSLEVYASGLILIHNQKELIKEIKLFLYIIISFG